MNRILTQYDTHEEIVTKNKSWNLLSSYSALRCASDGIVCTCKLKVNVEKLILNSQKLLVVNDPNSSIYKFVFKHPKVLRMLCLVNPSIDHFSGH